LTTPNVDTFVVVVVGAGPAGEAAAGDLAQRGRTVAVVEAALVGGECAFYACMPSKALLRPAEILAETRRVPGAAEGVTGSLDVAFGCSRAKRSSSPISLAAAFRELAIDVRLGVRAKSVARDGASVTVELSDGGRVQGQELLVAVGRRPLTDDLGFETVGLEPGEPIAVDDSLRVTGLPWLYAVGDVNGRSLLTHMGKHQARIAAAVIAGGDARAVPDSAPVPRVIFTDPQVAAVGLTLAEARDRGIDARAYDVATSATAGASFHGRNTAGTARLVVDERRGLLIGATFTGFEVAEWLHAATIALVGEIPLERLWYAVPAFPTRSEVWLRLLEQRGALGAER
jgi:dihydrolipoamide dehydrogenase